MVSKKLKDNGFLVFMLIVFTQTDTDRRLQND